VRYRRISTVVDEWFTFVSLALDKLGRFSLFKKIKAVVFFRNVKRPLFASKLFYLTYVLQVARDLKREKCDIVHLHNFFQFVPIIRAFNPKIKIVLHMHCEWLTQLDRTMIENRLRKVDLIIGCSEYITEKARLVKRYSLHNKDIMEIELGNNRGVGIDPAYAKDRIHSKASDCLTFIRDYSDTFG